MTREQIIADNPICRLMESRGHVFSQMGKESVCICPFHADQSPSFRVNTDKGTWYCDPCKVGGSVIDLVMKLDGLDVKAAMEKLGGTNVDTLPVPSTKPKPVKSYDYLDANGKQLFQVIRFEPKTFRQRHMGADGKWIWSMDGVSRVLYRLPEVMEAQIVCIVEGEKDADNIAAMGMTATCNVGGAGKWLDAYTESLGGKDVILCADNDEPGLKHMDLVAESLSGKVKTLRRVAIPLPHKDVSDFLASFPDKAKSAEAWMMLVEKSRKIHAGVDLPIKNMGEMEDAYKTHIENIKHQTLSLTSWLPTLGRNVRGIVPGEMIVITAETGVGKTALLYNLACHCAPLPTLIFQIELPDSLSFERFMQFHHKSSGEQIEKTYYEKHPKGWDSSALDHIHVASLSKVTAGDIEKLILKAELKMGKKPVVVMVDYIQLVHGDGKSRYERFSNIAEDFRKIAKSTGTIMVIASQASRDKERSEIGLHDSKESGSIENSCSLMLGAWNDSTGLKIKVNKNSKGRKDFIIPCVFTGETMTIREAAPEWVNNGSTPKTP